MRIDKYFKQDFITQSKMNRDSVQERIDTYNLNRAAIIRTELNKRIKDLTETK
jgi:hypothetical protein